MSRGKSVLLWVVAVVIMFAAAGYQERTGPTKELKGDFEVAGETYEYAIIRSHNTTGDAPITVPWPGAPVTGVMYWKRLGTADAFAPVAMAAQDGELVAMLPAQPAAGKLEFYVELQSGEESIGIRDGEEPIVLRFKDPVSPFVLVPHIAFMFFAILFGIRTALGAALGDDVRRLAWTTLGLMTVGGMILGPIVQKQAFGAYWTGWPWGYDLTDNKTLIMWLAWVASCGVLQWKPEAKRLGRAVVLVGTLVMMVVYLIPHSLRGSELDYNQVDQGIPAEEAVTNGE
jgi:hypothetical protein